MMHDSHYFHQFGILESSESELLTGNQHRYFALQIVFILRQLNLNHQFLIWKKDSESDSFLIVFLSILNLSKKSRYLKIFFEAICNDKYWQTLFTISTSISFVISSSKSKTRTGFDSFWSHFSWKLCADFKWTWSTLFNSSSDRHRLRTRSAQTDGLVRILTVFFSFWYPFFGPNRI